jgi:hypothetical protein
LMAISKRKCPPAMCSRDLIMVFQYKNMVLVQTIEENVMISGKRSRRRLEKVSYLNSNTQSHKAVSCSRLQLRHVWNRNVERTPTVKLYSTPKHKICHLVTYFLLLLSNQVAVRAQI